MKTTLTVTLTFILLTGCAQQASVPPPAPPTAPPPAPAQAQVSAGVWDVDHVRCSDLLGAADEDREAASMFYYGYLAAKTRIHVIDVSKVDRNVAKVMNECAASPRITVMQAFQRALRRNR